VEGRVLVHLAREESLAQRTVRHEANAKFLESRYHFLLRSSRPQRIFALKCGERLNRVRATDCLDAGFRKAEVFYLTLLNQFLDRAGDVFDWHAGVDTMLIEQVDDIDLQSLERAF